MTLDRGGGGVVASLGLLLQLLLQLQDLGLQGRDGGLEAVLHRALQLAQLGPQLLVLPLQLLPGVLALLRRAALGAQLRGQGVHLQAGGRGGPGGGGYFCRNGLGFAIAS